MQEDLNANSSFSRSLRSKGVNDSNADINKFDFDSQEYDIEPDKFFKVGVYKENRKHKNKTINSNDIPNRKDDLKCKNDELRHNDNEIDNHAETHHDGKDYKPDVNDVNNTRHMIKKMILDVQRHDISQTMSGETISMKDKLKRKLVKDEHNTSLIIENSENNYLNDPINDPLHDSIYRAYHKKMLRNENRMLDMDLREVEDEADRLTHSLDKLNMPAWTTHLSKIAKINDMNDQDELKKKKRLSKLLLKNMLGRYRVMKKHKINLQKEIKKIKPVPTTRMFQLYTNVDRKCTVEYQSSSEDDSEDDKLDIDDLREKRLLKRERKTAGTIFIGSSLTSLGKSTTAIVAEPLRKPYVILPTISEKRKWSELPTLPEELKYNPRIVNQEAEYKRKVIIPLTLKLDKQLLLKKETNKNNINETITSGEQHQVTDTNPKSSKEPPKKEVSKISSLLRPFEKEEFGEIPIDKSFQISGILKSPNEALNSKKETDTSKVKKNKTSKHTDKIKKNAKIKKQKKKKLEKLDAARHKITSINSTVSDNTKANISAIFNCRSYKKSHERAEEGNKNPEDQQNVSFDSNSSSSQFRFAPNILTTFNFKALPNKLTRFVADTKKISLAPTDNELDYAGDTNDTHKLSKNSLYDLLAKNNQIVVKREENDTILLALSTAIPSIENSSKSPKQPYNCLSNSSPEHFEKVNDSKVNDNNIGSSNGKSSCETVKPKKSYFVNFHFKNVDKNENIPRQVTIGSPDTDEDTSRKTFIGSTHRPTTSSYIGEKLALSSSPTYTKLEDTAITICKEIPKETTQQQNSFSTMFNDSLELSKNTIQYQSDLPYSSLAKQYSYSKNNISKISPSLSPISNMSSQICEKRPKIADKSSTISKKSLKYSVSSNDVREHLPLQPTIVPGSSLPANKISADSVSFSTESSNFSSQNGIEFLDGASKKIPLKLKSNTKHEKTLKGVTDLKKCYELKSVNRTEQFIEKNEKS